MSLTNSKAGSPSLLIPNSEGAADDFTASTAVAVTANNQWAVWRATIGGVTRLYSRPVDRNLNGGAVVELTTGLGFPANADVMAFKLTPNSEWVVWLADHDVNDRYELWRKRIDGSGTAEKINVAMTSGKSVVLSGSDYQGSFQITANSTHVVWMADGTTASVTELFTRPLDLSTPELRINTALSGAFDVLQFKLSPDSQKVVWLADGELDVVSELYSRAIDGSGAQSKLNASLSGLKDVLDYEISTDSAYVVWKADADTDTIDELYSRVIDASTPQVKLNTNLTGALDVLDFAIGAGPSPLRVVWRADGTTDAVNDLYSRAIDGSDLQIKMNDNFSLAGSDVANFVLSPNGQWVVWLADKVTDSRFDLFRRKVDGSDAETNITLLPLGSAVLQTAGDYKISPDSSRIVYVADQEVNGRNELYSLTLDPLGSSVKLNLAFPNLNYDVLSFSVTPDSNRVVWRADAVTDALHEIYARSINGSGSPVKLNDPIVPSLGDVNSFIISPGSDYVVWQADAETDAVNQLYSERITGRGAPVVSGPLGGFPSTTVLIASGETQAAMPDYRSQVSAVDDGTLVGAITQTPAPGSLRSAGPVLVTLSAVDNEGNEGTMILAANFTDGTYPVITTKPRDRTLGASPSTDRAAAPNLLLELGASGTGITAVQSPAAGVLLDHGQTDIIITVTDSGDRTAQAITHITVTPQEVPVISGAFTPATVLVPGNASSALLPDYAAQATSTSGAVTQDPAPGAEITAGAMTVTLSATSAGQTGVLRFVVLTRDETPPGLTVPNNIVAEATSSAGAIVTFVVSANDNVSGIIPAIATPPSGSAFPFGDTTVTVTATDAFNNTTTKTFTVTVQDTIAPSFLPVGGPIIPQYGTITLEATGRLTLVDYAARLADKLQDDYAASWSVSDLVTTAPSVQYYTQGQYVDGAPRHFGLGLTASALVASDEAGNVSSRHFFIRVEDTTPPEITNAAAYAGGFSEPATDHLGSVVTYPLAQVFDVVGAATGAPDYFIVPTYSKASGTKFPVGTTRVKITAKDSSQNTVSVEFDVVVEADPEILVQQPLNTNLVHDVGVTDFGPLNLTSSRTLTFTIKSSGITNLTGLAITKSGDDMSDFTVGVLANTPLTPPGTRNFTVKFAPSAEGSRIATIHIASNANPSFDVHLTGEGFQKPAIASVNPMAQFVAVGDPAEIAVDASAGSGSTSYQWLKNNVLISAASNSSAVTNTFSIPVAALTHAAKYSVKVSNTASAPTDTIGGTVTSAAAALAVYSPKTLTTTPATFNEGGTLSLKISAAAAAGVSISYQWKKDGSNVTNGTATSGQVVSGATTATLMITRMTTDNAGNYACELGMTGASVTSGEFAASMLAKPVMDNPGTLSWTVSSTVTDLLTAAGSPTKFTATGLPAGVTLNAATGQLSGKPNGAASGVITVTASNAAGAGAPLTIPYTVAALPASFVGTFKGLVNRTDTLSLDATHDLSGLGGTLNVVTTSSGSISGSLVLEAKSHTLTGRLNAVATGDATATVAIVRGTVSDAIPDLTLSLTFVRTNGHLTGSVSDGSASAAVEGWRNSWSTTTPATALAGRYHAGLEIDADLQGDIDYPQGYGYVTLILAANGTATWTVKLADGTAPAVFSTTFGPNGEVPLHSLLYSPTVPSTAGSARGWVQAQPGATAGLADNTLDTMTDGGGPLFDWLKAEQAPASTTRSYKAGFALHKLTVVGGGYSSVGTTVRSMLGSLADTSNNARLVFSEGGIAGSSMSSGGTTTQTLSIGATNGVIMPTASNNPATVTMTLTPTTGLISGYFTLKDGLDVRKTQWFGLIVPRLNKGVGQFQLSQLPAPTTSVQLSGQVVLEKND